jgi:heme/copper-type cytochrome/quinol oxidase subunit 2
MLLFTCAVILLAPALAAAQTADEEGRPQAPLSDDERKQSLKQATALFIITLLMLLLLVAAMVVLLIIMRHRLRALERERPQLPTELEDLWWQMRPPEEEGGDKAEQ